MTDTGMTRPIDALGRVVIPKEIRKNLDLKPGDIMSLFVRGNEIIFVSKRVRCFCCGKDAETLWETPTGNYICPQCLNLIRRAAK